VGLIVLVDFGACGLGLVPLLNGGQMPTGRVLQLGVLVVAAALAGGWLYVRAARRSWRAGLLALPVIAVLGLLLLAASSLPMRQACRTYHTETVCPDWAR